MRLTRNGIIAISAGIIVVALVVWSFIASRREVAAESKREKAIAAPSRTTTVEGTTLVTLDAATLARSGIVVAPLAPASLPEQHEAFANVVDLDTLLATQKSYLAARADAARASAELVASQREYDRLHALNADRQNVSDKAVETALAAYRTAQANAESASTAARISHATAQQQWGAALAQRITTAEGLASFTTLAEVVLQVALPPGDTSAAAPSQISVTAPDHRMVTARLLGAASRTDPKLQGRTFLYLAPGAPVGLVPGMNVQVHLASGPPNAGVLIPTSSVIWTAGTSWVYVEVQPGKFARRAVTLDSPAPAGWFVTAGFNPGERVAVRGAQLLLSEEFRSQVQGSGGGD